MLMGAIECDPKFVVGQRVRVCRYECQIHDAAYGNPHCIIGHFGYVLRIGFYIDVEITHGPSGGPVDKRILQANIDDRQHFWPMVPSELEAVD